MGVVYQAWQPRLARRVAIKVVSVGIALGADDRRRWLREAQAIGQVRHRNIVQLHEAGELDGCLYLVFDLIPGGSLADRVSGPLPARVAVELMATIARVVDLIHSAGTLHLDIKPSNILLDGVPNAPWDQVTPMIADFGIARPGDDAGGTASGAIGLRGTPSFMAPEQIASDHAAIGPWSDVFALGATLYTLLSGRPPFHAASVIETLDLVRTREPAPLRTLVPGLPRDLETIAVACLRKEPRQRYASAGALADDLQRWLDGFPIRARPVSKLEHASRWCRRRPAFASLLAIFAFTVASSLAGLLTLWRQSETERSRAESALARAIESDKATSGAVRDLVALLTTTVDVPQMLASERFQKSSHAVRELTAKLRRHQGFAASNLVAICELERQLADDFRRRAKFTESRALLTDSLDLLDQQRHGKHASEVDAAYARALIEFGRVASDQNYFDEALDYLQRAENVMEDLVHKPQHLDEVFQIDQARQTIADLFGRRGLEEPLRRLGQLRLRALERWSANSGDDPAIGLLAVLAHLEIAPDHDACAKLRAAIEKFPADERPPQRFQALVAGWIVKYAQPYPADPNSIDKSKRRLDPDAHADAVIQTLESTCRAVGVYPALLPAVAIRVAGTAASLAAEQRKAGRLDDACQTAARLFAFAETLARRDPNQAGFHLALGIAYEQHAKNAWKVNDYVKIEASQRKALGEAMKALRLDPQNADARLAVAGLQDKLLGLIAERSPPQ